MNTLETTVQQVSPQPDERRGGTSASNAEADLRCPARHLAQKGYPADEAKRDWAEHGRVIHAALADSSGSGGLLVAKLSLEQRETYDRCRDIERKASLQIFPDQGSANPIKVVREQRYWVMVDGKFIHSAKPDLVFISGTRGLIIEYKTLPGDVPGAPGNLQLRDQAVLVAGQHGLAEVFVLVAQPMVTMKPEIVRYDAPELARSAAEMFARVRRSNDPASPRLAGEVQCEFCRAKLDCAEYNKFGGAMLISMSSLLNVPVSSWTPKQRGFFCDQLGTAQKWLDETKDAMKAGLEKEAGYVEGWHLAPGSERRSIVDPQSVFSRFAALGGTPEKFMRCVTISLTKLKEAINDMTGARGKALEAAINTLTEGLTETKRTAPSLKKNE